jgi:lichenan operon transcriptional antiterminator
VRNLFTLRQLAIIKYLYENKDDFVSSIILAKEQKISVRTVKNEISSIREMTLNSNLFMIVSTPSKGHRIKIVDLNQAKLYFDKINDSQVSYTFNEQLIRIKYVILLLLDANSFIQKYQLLYQLNISESTLYHDLKEVKKTLQFYHIELVYKSGSGYSVRGEEKNKRACLAKEEIYSILEENYETNANFKNITEVKEKLIDIFLLNQYKISDIILESLILHLVCTIQRIKKGHLIVSIQEKNEYSDKEYKIAKDILKQCISGSVSELEGEIKYLAINLSGKRNYDDFSSVSEDINNFIIKTLEMIRTEYGVDFSRCVDLKVALALHFVPLLSRMRNDRKLKNLLLAEIKQNFPFAFDIAGFFSLLIQDHYHIKVSEDEMAYFTLYFNYGLESVTINSEGKKLLVISSLKPSETILLRHKIYQWFKTQILKLDFINTVDIERCDLTEYDVLFTTEKKDTLTKGAAVVINLFPTEHDFNKMNLAINGYNSIDSVLSRFSPNLFYTGEAHNKNEIVEKLIEVASKSFSLPKKFKQIVLEREKLSSTYFGCHVAMPHPLYPITNQTFVVVALLEKEVAWDENQTVKIVMMVSTEVNNPKAFQLWPYLSTVISSQDIVDEILTDLTFEHFINVLKANLLEKF